MNFGAALEALKKGDRVTREGWNGKGMYIRAVDLYTDKSFKITEIEPTDGTILYSIWMKTADNAFVPWTASQTDLLSEDWQVLVTTF